MYPGCYGNDCRTWGWSKALDNIQAGLKSLAHTSFGNNPYIQFDLGSVQSTLSAVMVVARADCCLERASNLNLYLSSTSSIQLVTAFAIGVSAPGLGQTLTVAVPNGISGQYLAILRNGSATSVNVQEVSIIASGEQATSVQWMACSLWAWPAAVPPGEVR